MKAKVVTKKHVKKLSVAQKALKAALKSGNKNSIVKAKIAVKKAAKKVHNAKKVANKKAVVKGKKAAKKAVKKLQLAKNALKTA
jgi:hypothetical protein